MRIFNIHRYLGTAIHLESLNIKYFPLFCTCEYCHPAVE
jgi:hypothetical protein